MRGGAANCNDNFNGLPSEHRSPTQGSRLRDVKELLGLWMERNRAPVRASRPGQLGPATRGSLLGQFSATPPVPRASAWESLR
jgi:hypothetical protein